MLFIETKSVTAWVTENLTDDAYARFQRSLLEDPTAGVVMPGCGGLRKIRAADPRRQKGKRSGARIVYPYVPEAERVYLVLVYTKDAKETLTPGEKASLQHVAEQIKADAIKAHRATERPRS